MTKGEPTDLTEAELAFRQAVKTVFEAAEVVADEHGILVAMVTVKREDPTLIGASTNLEDAVASALFAVGEEFFKGRMEKRLQEELLHRMPSSKAY